MQPLSLEVLELYWAEASYPSDYSLLDCTLVKFEEFDDYSDWTKAIGTRMPVSEKK